MVTDSGTKMLLITQTIFFTLLLKTCFYFTLLMYDENNFIDIFRILSSFSREIQKVCYVVYVYI